MKIYFVRHGQTDWNIQQKMQGGQAENSLNETGIEQAKQAKEKLKNIEYDIIIRSPMKRVEQTLNIINEGRNVPIIIDERIRERIIGELEGHYVTDEIENKIWDYKLNYDIPGGENMQDFSKRIINLIEEIKQKYNDKTVLMVAHGGVAKVLKAYFGEMPESKNLVEIKVGNCEILKFEN